ncbi:MAG: hypothetical protein M3N93_11665 [Acidobacteriota bacterium]|nr:hypothetical protein [Acidobacteriota bacterium]
MKTFHFRLDRALRWRETQVGLQKMRLAAATARLADIENTLEHQRVSLSQASSHLQQDLAACSFQFFAGFCDRARIRIRDLEAQAAVAKRSVAVEMNRLIEASQKARLLDNLKDADLARWRQDFDRELAAFADEAFLGRLQSR